IGRPARRIRHPESTRSVVGGSAVPRMGYCGDERWALPIRSLCLLVFPGRCAGGFLEGQFSVGAECLAHGLHPLRVLTYFGWVNQAVATFFFFFFFSPQ